MIDRFIEEHGELSTFRAMVKFAKKKNVALASQEGSWGENLEQTGSRRLPKLSLYWAPPSRPVYLLSRSAACEYQKSPERHCQPPVRFRFTATEIAHGMWAENATRRSLLKKLIICAASVAALAAPASALAAGNAQSGPTVGDCISDVFYGNEPNIVGPFAPGGPAEQEPGTQAGRVVPSQSPGPKVTLPNGTVVDGPSVGAIQQQFGPGIVPAVCRALTS
jgi:hypothetical protein